MMQKTKQMNNKKKNSFLVKLKKRMYLLLALSPILYLCFSIFKWPVYNSLLDKYAVVKEATIINEKNIQGKGVITQMFTYSYAFSANGKLYNGDSKKRGYKIGNKIEVEYLESFPSINRPKQIKE
ncbi:hypothetical protein AB674_02120 [Flavobacterium sp. ABG]|nr:hypothetical protein AB674_02120 [Flavobacterium sp. ABG]